MNRRIVSCRIDFQTYGLWNRWAAWLGCY